MGFQWKQLRSVKGEMEVTKDLQQVLLQGVDGQLAVLLKFLKKGVYVWKRNLRSSTCRGVQGF